MIRIQPFLSRPGDAADQGTSFVSRHSYTPRRHLYALHFFHPNTIVRVSQLTLLPSEPDESRLNFVAAEQLLWGSRLER